MAIRFTRPLFLLFFLFSLNLFFLPLPTEAAGLVPCGRTQDDPTTAINEAVPCTLCHLILGVEGIIQWGLKVMTYIAIAVIVAMGILYIVSAGNDSLMETAKKGIWASLIGFAVMLGAWLIVNTVIMTLADTSDPGKPLATLQSQGAFRFTCDVRSNAGISSGVVPNPGVVTSGGDTGTPAGSGKCPVATTGPCSVENLKKTCFGANAEMASAICVAESGNDATLYSGVDRCEPGREPVSWGLFQINISAHTIGGLSCPAPNGAFDRMYTGVKANPYCSIRQPLYSECVTKAQNKDANIQKACELSQNGARWGQWGANGKCGFPK